MMRLVLQAELPQEQRAQLAASLASFLDHSEQTVHWLHDHAAEAKHVLSLFGVFGQDGRLLLLLSRLFEQLKTCSTCVIAYHAAQVYKIRCLS